MKKSFLYKYQFILGLFSLGLFYTLIVLLKCYDGFRGDENGYISIASELAEGKLSSVHWWGPGYPMILIPFVKFSIPLIYAKLLNVAFLIFTILYIRKSLLLYLNNKLSNYLSLIMGIYLPFLFYIHMLISEKFALLLMSGVSYHYLACHNNNNFPNFFLASLLLAWLALTKVFYGYVILAALIILSLYSFFWQRFYSKSFFILLISLCLCFPYLYYNYKLTGKYFYWARSGGLQLYWMSTPYPGETGTWFGEFDLYGKNIPVNINHYKFFDSLSDLKSVESGEKLKKEAIKNIYNNPKKYLFNILNNLFRMLFDFPYDFKMQDWKISWVVIPNMFLLSIFIFSLYPALRCRKHIPPQLFFLLWFGIIAIGGGALISAYNRMFTLIVPIIYIFCIFVLIKFVKIEINST